MTDTFYGWSLSTMLVISIAFPYIFFGWRGSAGAALGFVTMFVVMFIAANWKRR